MVNRDLICITETIAIAAQARSLGDLPIGAMLVLPNHILKEHNSVYSEKDITNHAEINVIRKATQLGFRRLREGILYCSVEPCPMCVCFALEHGIKELVFGAYDKRKGFHSCGIFNEEKLPITFRGGILAEECIAILPDHLREYITI